MKNWFSQYSTERIGARQERVFGLDLFRSIAILSVMGAHAGSFGWLPGKLHAAGVEWFFVLSGFLIGQIIIRDFKKGSSWSDIWFFWRRRWFRTLPNYYLILLLNVVLANLEVNNPDYESFSWKFLFFLHNFDQAFYGFFWESWSLSIEEWFYIIFPLIAIVLLNIKWINKQQAILISIIFLIIAPIFIKFFEPVPPNMNQFIFGNTYKKIVLFRLDSLAYGILLAYFKVYHKSLWSKASIWLAVIGTLLLQTLMEIEADLQNKWYLIFIFPVHSIGIALLIPLFDSWLYAPKIISRPISWISKISYSLYLLHLSIILGLLNYAIDHGFEELKNYYQAVYWLSAVSIASLMFIYFEKPLTALRPKYPPSNSQNT